VDPEGLESQLGACLKSIKYCMPALNEPGKNDQFYVPVASIHLLPLAIPREDLLIPV
jgi:hypothetical protein